MHANTHARTHAHTPSLTHSRKPLLILQVASVGLATHTATGIIITATPNTGPMAGLGTSATHGGATFAVRKHDSYYRLLNAEPVQAEFIGVTIKLD